MTKNVVGTRADWGSWAPGEFGSVLVGHIVDIRDARLAGRRALNAAQTKLVDLIIGHLRRVGELVRVDEPLAVALGRSLRDNEIQWQRLKEAEGGLDLAFAMTPSGGCSLEVAVAQRQESLSLRMRL